jgi:hypothetical protein
MHVRLAWLVSLVLGCAAAASADEIYRYKDEQGMTHFTDSYYEIPERYRDQVREISGEIEGSGGVSVVPGFGAPPGKEGEAKAGAKDGKKKDGDGRVAQALASARQRLPGAAGASTGLIVFMVLLGVLVGLAIGGGLLTAACNIVGERPLALGQAMLIVFLQAVCSALASGALNLTVMIAGEGPALALIAGVGGFAASAGVDVAILKGMHCETWFGAIKVTLAATLLGLLLSAPFLYCALR